MIILADQGYDVARDDGCRLLFSLLQDSAYKLRNEAERERQAHLEADTCPEEGDSGDTAGKFLCSSGGVTMGCKKRCCEQESFTEEKRLVLTALLATAEPVAGKEIAALTGLDAKIVSSGLKTMKDAGWVDSPVRCKYALTDLGKTLLIR
jgi:hypothetical protein